MLCISDKESKVMRHVLITQTMMKQYRVPFFERLQDKLAQKEILLRVAYGDPPPLEQKKGDNIDLSPGLGLKVRNRFFYGGRVVYQPLLREIRSADLVIVEQANKHVLNYLLLALSSLKLKKVAFWGHGLNRQARKQGASEWLKRQMLGKVDWWFAYTQGTANYLSSQGVSRQIITAVQNSVDTAAFSGHLNKVDADVLRLAKDRYGIAENAEIGLFCGSLYPDKHIDFLLDVAVLVKNEIPAFELVIIGNGPQIDLVNSASQRYPWIHCIGETFGAEKAAFFKMANVFLNPGLIGLAILDAFTAGLPVITTNVPIHSPEIEYLKNGENGLITQFDRDDYATALKHLLKNQELQSRLKNAALTSSTHYSLDAMVENFASGIVNCLNRVPEV